LAYKQLTLTAPDTLGGHQIAKVLCGIAIYSHKQTIQQICKI